MSYFVAGFLCGLLCFWVWQRIGSKRRFNCEFKPIFLEAQRAAEEHRHEERMAEIRERNEKIAAIVQKKIEEGWTPPKGEEN